MSVLSCLELHDNRSGEESLDSKFSRKHTRRFRITTSSRYDGSGVAISALPGLGTPHPTIEYISVQRRRVTSDSKAKTIFVGEVEYSTRDNAPGQQKTGDPFSDAAQIEWNTDTTQKPFFQDKDGKGLCNKAGEPFEGAVKDDVSLWTVSITKKLPFVPTWINNYRDAVNSEAITIDGLLIGVGMAKIKSIRISPWQSQDSGSQIIWYRTLSLAIKIQDDWKIQMPNLGLYCRDDSGNFVRCTDDNNKPVVKPVQLDADGKQVADPSMNTATFVEVDLRNTQPFSFLPLN